MSDAPVIANFRAALDLHETGVELMRQNLRRSHPDATDDEIEHLVGAWLRDRPGAGYGDADGEPIDVKAWLGRTDVL